MGYKEMTEDIPLTQLRISDFNVRKEVGNVTELAQSLSEKGLLQPVLVRPENGKYGVIIGSRRYTAAKEAKLHKIPATIKEMDDDEAMLVSLMENVHRNDLEPKETATAVGRLLETSNMRDLGKRLGKSHMWIKNMSNLVNLVYKLDKHNIKVAVLPTEKERDFGDVIPVNHAIHLANALDAPQVQKFFQSLPEEEAELKQVNLAKAIAPLKQLEAQKGLELLRKRPDAPIDEIVDHATSLESFGLGGGGGGGSISSSGTTEISAAVGREINGKLIWNLKRIHEQYDFYTIGYGYSEIDEFCDRLKIKGIKTLVDVRDNPTSIYKPEYDKDTLKTSLKKVGINYIHRPELGVPKEHRNELHTEEDFNKLWKWYDKNVLPTLNIIDSEDSANTLFDNLIGESKFNGPYVFMCRELDPTKCHRHRIAKALEQRGITSLDL